MVFVVWNFLPCGNELYEAPAYSFVWPVIFSSLIDYRMYSDMGFDELARMAFFLVTLCYGVLSFFLVPMWAVFHASNFIRIPLAVIGMSGGLILVFGMAFLDWAPSDTDELILMILITFQLIFGSTALFVFKNELALRNARREGR